MKNSDELSNEENDPVAPLKPRPSLGMYNMKSPAPFNTISENSVLTSFNLPSNESHPSESTNTEEHHSPNKTNPLTSVNISSHGWRSASFRTPLPANGDAHINNFHKPDEHHFSRTFSLRVDCPVEDTRLNGKTPTSEGGHYPASYISTYEAPLGVSSFPKTRIKEMEC